MAGISYNTGATGGAANVTSINYTAPAGVLVNDVMILGIVVFTEDSTQPAFSVTSTGSEVWTIVSPVELAAGAGIYTYGFVYSAVATASSAHATVTVSETGSPGSTTWIGAAMASYTGARTTSSIDVIGGTSIPGQSAFTITCPTKTTNAANDWGIYIMAGGNNGSGVSVPSGTTQRQLASTGGGMIAVIADSNGIVGPASTTIGGGVFTNTADVASNCWLTAFTIGLAPAPVNPGGFMPLF
ncbi:MAG TPA: hypothetical protein VGS28_04060 [Candidatus Saccharimonadales bacterium]|nr:hypothetical protein [Candidatus Saccharimonadales bacterium]